LSYYFKYFPIYISSTLLTFIYRFLLLFFSFHSILRFIFSVYTARVAAVSGRPEPSLRIVRCRLALRTRGWPTSPLQGRSSAAKRGAPASKSSCNRRMRVFAAPRQTHAGACAVRSRRARKGDPPTDTRRIRSNALRVSRLNRGPSKDRSTKHCEERESTPNDSSKHGSGLPLTAATRAALFKGYKSVEDRKEGNGGSVQDSLDLY